MQQISVRQAPSGPSVLLNIPTTTDDLANASTVNGGTGTLTQALNTLNSVASEITRDRMVVSVADGTEFANVGGTITNLGADVVAAIANPYAERYYSAQCEFDIYYYNGGGLDATFQAKIQGSIDGGGSWFNISQSGMTITINSPLAGAITRRCAVALAPVLGSALGVVTGVTPSLRIRVLIANAVPSGSSLRVQSAEYLSSPDGGSCIYHLTERLAA